MVYVDVVADEGEETGMPGRTLDRMCLPEFDVKISKHQSRQAICVIRKIVIKSIVGKESVP